MASTPDATASAEPETFDQADDPILSNWKSVYVKAPVAQRNLADARGRFVREMTDGFGVQFSTLCEMNGGRMEQEYHLMGKGLKLVAQTNYVAGTPVGSWLAWLLLLIPHRSRSALKKELLP